MPDDALDLSITEAQRTWTLEMLRYLGLKPLDSGATYDRSESDGVDLVETYAKRVEARKAAQASIVTDKARLDELETEIAEATGTRQLELERAALAQRNKIATHERQAASIGAAESALYMLLRVDYTADQELETAQNSLARVNDMEVAEDRPSSLHEDLAGQEDALFADAVEKVKARIKNAHEVQTFTVTYTVDLPNGTQKNLEKTFPVISDAEADILDKMVELAEATYTKQGYDAGQVRLEQVDARLGVFTAARRGQVFTTKPDTLDDRVDGKLSVVESWIARLRSDGFSTVADELETTRAAIANDLQNTFDTVGFKIEPMIARADALIAEGVEKTAAVDAIKVIHEQTKWLHRTVEQSGTPDHNRRATEIEAGIDRTGSVDTCRSSAEAAHRLMTALVETVKQTQTAAQVADFDLDAERAKIAVLEARYLDLFKTDRKGNIKTIEDSATGAQKGSKRNSALPREVIRDFEVSIQKAKLRLESGATEVAVGAREDIAALESAFDRLDDRPKLYKDLADGLIKAEKELTKLDKNETIYCVQERARLKIELAELKKRVNDIDTAAVNTSLTVLNGKIDTHKDEIATQKTEIAGYATRIKAERKKLTRIAKLSATAAALTNRPAVSGDYGDQATELAAIEAILSRPDPEDLKLVDGRLIVVSAVLDEILAAFTAVKATAKGNRNGLPIINPRKRAAAKEARAAAALDLDEFKIVEGFMKQARTAERAHEANMADKPAYEAEAKKLTSLIKGAKTKLQRHDRSANVADLDAVAQEIKALNSEMKSSEEYTDGVAQLVEVKKRASIAYRKIADRLKAEDADLVELAITVRQGIAALETAIGQTSAKIAEAADADYAPDGNYDKTKIEAFLDSVTTALGDMKTTDMAREANTVANKTKEVAARKSARAAALKILRLIMVYLNSSAQLKHAADQPFDPEIVRQLARLKVQTSALEVKLLTALGTPT